MSALSLLLGRQFQDADSAWRLEGEYWAGRLKREEFRAGVLQATLDDEIDVDVLFVNAMYRLTGQERSGLWIGAGIGYADVVMPGAVTPGSCSCLDEAEGDGTAWQVRLEYERALAANTFWSAGIAYLWLPESSTRTTGPSFAEHGKLSGGGLRFALRHRF